MVQRNLKMTENLRKERVKWKTKPEGKMGDTERNEDVLFIVLGDDVVISHHPLLSYPTPIFFHWGYGNNPPEPG